MNKMKKMAVLCSAALACATLVFPAVSHAARFGDAGTLAPNGVVGFNRSSVSDSDDSQTATMLSLAPQLQYFVVDNLAIGAGLSFFRSSGSDSVFTSTAYGISPSIAYSIGLSDNVTLFPTATLSYLTSSTTVTVGETETDSSKSAIQVGLAAPVLFHFNNFFIGAGPYFQTDLSSKAKVGDGDSEDASKATTMGLTSVVGGWF